MSRQDQTGRETVPITEYCAERSIEHDHILAEDGYADGGVPYSEAELKVMNGCTCWNKPTERRYDFEEYDKPERPA